MLRPVRTRPSRLAVAAESRFVPSELLPPPTATPAPRARGIPPLASDATEVREYIPPFRALESPVNPEENVRRVFRARHRFRDVDADDSEIESETDVSAKRPETRKAPR